MYTIAKQFEFSASHRLEWLPITHPCHNLHGHNYVVTVTLKSEELNENSFVVDFRELDKLKIYLNERFDHKHLNDQFDRPTVELLAKHLYMWCKQIWPQTHTVRVSETPKTWAEYRR